MSNIKFKIADDSGYTIIETLVALTIFLIVLIPTIYFITDLLTNPGNMDKIIAINLAEKEMECCIMEGNYFDKEYIENVNGREYRVRRNISKEGTLVTIEVIVLLEKPGKQLAKFQTIRSLD